jgi:hypothetical protein
LATASVGDGITDIQPAAMFDPQTGGGIKTARYALHRDRAGSKREFIVGAVLRAEPAGHRQVARDVYRSRANEAQNLSGLSLMPRAKHNRVAPKQRQIRVEQEVLGNGNIGEVLSEPPLTINTAVPNALSLPSCKRPEFKTTIAGKSG